MTAFESLIDAAFERRADITPSTVEPELARALLKLDDNFFDSLEAFFQVPTPSILTLDGDLNAGRNWFLFSAKPFIRQKNWRTQSGYSPSSSRFCGLAIVTTALLFYCSHKCW
jgi:hypothetical protein